MPRQSILTAQEREDVRRQLAENPRFGMPAWDDVIHIQPDWMLEPKELARRKYARALRMKETSTSKLSQDVSWYMTQIDNAQDALVTLSVAGRMAALAVPRLKPAALLVGRAADALNLGNMLTLDNPERQNKKRQLEGRFRAVPGYYRGRVRGATSLGRALPNYAESLQVLQTTDQLAGTGISLGAIMAAPTTLVAQTIKDIKTIPTLPKPTAPESTLARAALLLGTLYAAPSSPLSMRIKQMGLAGAVSFAAPATAALGLATEVISQLPPFRRNEEAAKADAAARALIATEGLALADHRLTPQDHLTVAIAHHLALNVLIETFQHIPAGDLLTPYKQLSISATPPTDPLTQAALREIGIDPRDPGALPLEGFPQSAPILEYAAEVKEKAPRVLDAWRSALDTDDQEDFAGALTCYAARETWQIFEDHDPQLEHSYSPLAKAALLLTQYGTPIPKALTPEQLYAVLQDLGERWYATDRHSPPPDVASADFAQLLERF